jgi:hypothetical protein
MKNEKIDLYRETTLIRIKLQADIIDHFIREKFFVPEVVNGDFTAHEYSMAMEALSRPISFEYWSYFSDLVSTFKIITLAGSSMTISDIEFYRRHYVNQKQHRLQEKYEEEFEKEAWNALLKLYRNYEKENNND